MSQEAHDGKGSGAAVPATRASLLVRVRDPRDAKAWRQFVAAYGPVVRRYCARRGLQDADADDVTQDVMRAVTDAVRRFAYDPPRGRFRDWLFTVTRSKLSNHYHRRRQQEQGSGRTTVQQLLAGLPDPLESAEWDQDCRRQVFEWAAREARSEFEPSTWRAFVLSAIDGRAAKDVAGATGLSVSAVYVAKSRVLARLKALVASLDNAVGQ